MQLLLAEAARLGVGIAYAALPAPRRGFYSPTKSLIVLSTALTLLQRWETLAHELGHAYYGHDCTSPTNEAQAWRRAAFLTVDPARYAIAESIHPHPSAIANELDLTPALIEAWQTHVYPAISERLAA